HLGSRSDVVEPRWVPWAARIRGDDRYAIAVVEVDDCVTTCLPGARAARLQQGCGDRAGCAEPSARQPQQQAVDPPEDGPADGGEREALKQTRADEAAVRAIKPAALGVLIHVADAH